MKKSFLLSAAIASIAFALSIGVVPIAAQTVPRTVLMEEGTNWACGPCAALNPYVDTFLDAHTGSVIQIAYHPNWPGATDPIYLNDQTDNQYRVASYYGINGVPSVVFDGGTPFNPDGIPLLENAYESRLAVGSPVALTVTHTFSADSLSVNVHVVVHPVQDLSSYKSLYLRVAAVEDWVDGPGPNREAIYPHALRTMMPSYRGTRVLLSTRDTSFDFSYDIEDSYHAERMYEVAFLQNDQGHEVLQAATDKPEFAVTLPLGMSSVKRAATSEPVSIGMNLSNTLATTNTFTIRFVRTSSNAWPLTIQQQDGSTPVSVSVAPGDVAPIQVAATVGEGSYMSGDVIVSTTYDGKKLESEFPVKFIAPDVRMAFVDVSGDSIRSANTIASLGALQYRYVPMTSGEMSLFNGWNPKQFGVVVVEGNKWIITGSDKQNLSAYLDAGGRALVTGGELAFGLADPASTSTDRDEAFLEGTLHATYVRDSAGPRTVRGVSGDAVSGDFASKQVNIYAEDIDAPNQPDEIAPTNGAIPVYYYGTGDQVAGIRWNDDATRLVYLSFGVQNLAETDRDPIIKDALDWLGEAQSSVQPTGGTPLLLETSVFPNPAHGTLHVTYSLPAGEPLTITLVDVTGRVVATLLNQSVVSGQGNLIYNTGNLVSGTYLCIARSRSRVVTQGVVVP